MKFKIGVMGSASGKHAKENIEKARAIGEEIAKQDCAFFYGATIGLPLEAARAAKKAKALVIGISPAENEKEHLEKYKYPIDACDIVIYTGLGLAGGRNVILVKSCNAVIIIGGRVGTLNEFSIAYAAEKIIGVLEGTGGIADEARRLEKIFNKEMPTKIVYSASPKELVEKIILELKKQ